MKRWRYFSESEVEGLEPFFVSMLDMARHFSEVMYIITSGKRNPNSNVNAGGVEDSAHIKGLAVDLKVFDSRTRYKVLKGLILAGFNRIGVYEKHIHVDYDLEKPPDVIWRGQYKP